jgi:hypothetical protein
MTSRERELLMYASPEEVSMRVYHDPGYQMSRYMREAMEHRERTYFDNALYTVAYAMRNA